MNRRCVSNEEAYPLTWNDGDGNVQLAPGLTKREWFAGMALCGLSADETAGRVSYETMAQWAVKRADALIKALNDE